MSDLIDRQAAIDAIVNITVFYNSNSIKDTCKRFFYNDNGWLGGIKDSIEAIEALPSAQPEDQWIIDALKEHLGESYKPITENEKEFKDWLERMRWHVLECDKLARELEQAKASAQPETHDKHTETHVVCLDMISRQAAIEAVRRLVIAGWGTDHGVMDSDVIYETLEELQPEPIRINLNEPIRVKLTDWGKEIYYHQYDRTNQIAGREICKPKFPKEDENDIRNFSCGVL